MTLLLGCSDTQEGTPIVSGCHSRSRWGKAKVGSQYSVCELSLKPSFLYGSLPQTPAMCLVSLQTWYSLAYSFLRINLGKEQPFNWLPRWKKDSHLSALSWGTELWGSPSLVTLLFLVPLHSNIQRSLALPIPGILGEAMVKRSYFRLLLGVAISFSPVLLVLCLKQNNSSLSF